jgi:hypothetical protein
MMKALAPLALLAAAAPPPAASRDRPEVAAWMQCLADQALRFAPSNESAEIAADATMGACTAQEAALVAAERRGVAGAALDSLMRAERDGRVALRQRVIARIVELRTPR